MGALIIGIIIVFLLFTFSPKLRFWLDGGKKGLKDYEDITGEEASTFGNNKMVLDEETKFNLVTKFSQQRMDSLGFNEDLSLMPQSQLLGLPECNIVTIIESYYLLKKRGETHNNIIEIIELQRSEFDVQPIVLKNDLSLKDYIYARIEHELPLEAGFHVGENGFTIQHINNIYNSANKIYNLS